MLTFFGQWSIPLKQSSETVEKADLYFSVMLWKTETNFGSYDTTDSEWEGGEREERGERQIERETERKEREIMCCWRDLEGLLCVLWSGHCPYIAVKDISVCLSDRIVW